MQKTAGPYILNQAIIMNDIIWIIFNFFKHGNFSFLFYYNIFFEKSQIF